MKFKAYKILKPFFQNIKNDIDRIKINNKFLKCYNLISMIQKKMKNYYWLKKGKIEVLETYWDRIYLYIQTKCIHLKDGYGNEICKKILKIPNEVRQFVLKKYMD